MKYRVEETDEVYDNIDDVIDACIDEDWHWDDDYFPEWVDENEDHVTINGETYYAYQILSELDDDNLNNLHHDYCEQMNEEDADEARRQLMNASEGDRIEIQNYVVSVVEDDEETGDTDGDGSLDYLRERIQREIELANSEKAEEKKTENDLMNMFQIVGV